jgi:NADPH:quinone reductase-like Zn-dependent oxidoreductase
MQPNGDQLDVISKMVSESTIKPVVDKTYSFEDGIEAYLHLATGRATGKVIIKMS